MPMFIRITWRGNKNLSNQQWRRNFVAERMREKTNLILHPEVKKAALALAEARGRSLSELVERLLERELERNNPQATTQHEKPAAPTELCPPELHKQKRNPDFQ